MPAANPVPETPGESSTSAAKKALAAAANGTPNYELPWYVYSHLISSSVHSGKWPLNLS